MKTQIDLVMAFYAILGIAVSFHTFYMAWLARDSKTLLVLYGEELYMTIGIFAVLFLSGVIVFLFWLGEYIDGVHPKRRY